MEFCFTFPKKKISSQLENLLNKKTNYLQHEESAEHVCANAKVTIDISNYQFHKQIEYYVGNYSNNKNTKKTMQCDTVCSRLARIV